jgi:hypothetical protein
MPFFKRGYLLLSLLLPICWPLIPWPEVTAEATAGWYSLPLEVHQHSATVASVLQPEVVKSSLPIGWIIYVGVTAMLLVRLAWNYRQIRQLRLSGSVIKHYGCLVVLLDQPLAPFSFGRFIYVNRSDWELQRIPEVVWMHESAHVNQRHSLDILLLECLQAFCWFNPFWWGYKQAIRLNHEFLADAAVLRQSVSVQTYQQILLTATMEAQARPLTQSFNYSFIKNRMMMMTQIRTGWQKSVRLLLLFPCLAGAGFLFSKQSVAQVAKPPAQVAPVLTVPSTQEGASDNLMQEYARLVDRVRNKKGVPVVPNLTEVDKARMENIFLLMSKEQQNKQEIQFMQAPLPPPIKRPTKQQLNDWKDAHKYGVWIDEKRVSNEVLSQYKPEDISMLWVSKLAKNAVNYGKHYYQVSLLTNAGYEKYLQESKLNENKRYVVLNWRAAIAGH